MTDDEPVSNRALMAAADIVLSEAIEADALGFLDQVLGHVCRAPGCAKPIAQPPVGKRRLYCSESCSVRGWRAAQRRSQASSPARPRRAP